MVYSGDKLIFGVQLFMIDVINYITKYIKNIDKDSYEIILDDIERYDLKNDIKYAYNYFEEIVKKMDLSIELISPPCCIFTDDNDDIYSKVYLGMNVCSNHIVKRFEPYKFETYDNYKKFIMEGIVYGEKNLELNKKKCIDDLEKILPKTKNKPKYYSMPNDCYSCT